MSWDDAIVNDGNGGYILLEEGDYNFTVSAFERGHYAGGAKLSACPKAALKLEIQTDSGTATALTDLLLHHSLEWKLAAFFRCIGQKKQGERLQPKWNSVLGAKGRAHFKPRVYTGNDGIEKKTNNVDYFIDYDAKYFTSAGVEMDDEAF